MNTSSTPPEQAVRSLPVVPTAIEAYRQLVANLRFVPAAIFLPAMIYLVWFAILRFSGLLELMVGPEALSEAFEGADPSRVFMLSLLSFLVQAFATSLLYVAWYRLILLGPEAGRPRFLYPIAGRHLRFFGHILLVLMLVTLATSVLFIVISFVIGLFAAFLSLAPAIAGGVIGLLVALCYLLLLIKFSFVFPAIAVDEAYGLKNAWQQSTGQEIRLVAGFLLCFLPALLVVIGANWDIYEQIWSGGEMAVPSSPLRDVFVTIVGVLNGLVLISYFSVAFKTCSGWVPELPDRRDVEPWRS